MSNYNSILMEDKKFLQRQENLYWNAGILTLDKKWYRRLYGGQWRYIKIGKDTPNIGMFCTWTKMGDECWSGYIKVLEIENYPITGADTKWKLFKEFFKQLFKKNDS